jgi:hypothetical protein
MKHTRLSAISLLEYDKIKDSKPEMIMLFTQQKLASLHFAFGYVLDRHGQFDRRSCASTDDLIDVHEVNFDLLGELSLGYALFS